MPGAKESMRQRYPKLAMCFYTSHTSQNHRDDRCTIIEAAIDEGVSGLSIRDTGYQMSVDLGAETIRLTFGDVIVMITRSTSLRFRSGHHYGLDGAVRALCRKYMTDQERQLRRRRW